jgi:hypothetical protein
MDVAAQQPQEQKHMDRADKASMNDVVFGGAPPPPLPKPVPAPEIRRDSLGRRISQRALDALKAGQFRPGQSGNPGGSYKKRTVLDAAIRLMKAGNLQPSDSIADFLNLLGED